MTLFKVRLAIFIKVSKSHNYFDIYREQPHMMSDVLGLFLAYLLPIKFGLFLPYLSTYVTHLNFWLQILTQNSPSPFLQAIVHLKVAFCQKVRCIFHIAKINIPNHYPELEIWISCLHLWAGNSNFKFFGTFFWEIWKTDLTYWKKAPLV